MNQLIYIILVVFMAAMIYKNIKLLKRGKHTKQYVACTTEIFANNPDVISMINDYVDNETENEFKVKGRIIKVYAELKYNINPANTLSFIDLHDIIYTKNNIDTQKMEMNSDSFYWMIMNNILAHLNNDEESIAKMNEILNQYNDLINNDLVVELYHQVDNALAHNEEGVKFLKDLLAGEYSGYRYDKRMIGMYKDVALATLAYLGEEISEEDREGLYNFAEMKAGRLLLANYGLLDEYTDNPRNNSEELEETVEEETTEEVEEEIVEETEETTTEEVEDTNGEA